MSNKIGLCVCVRVCRDVVSRCQAANVALMNEIKSARGVDIATEHPVDCASCAIVRLDNTRAVLGYVYKEVEIPLTGPEGSNHVQPPEIYSPANKHGTQILMSLRNPVLGGPC